MSKKTIVLADNSYTIRRIVELSFSEEEDINLVSFESSFNLREKLLELRPAVVLVDIKLPEFNGYEVCKFINATEGLAHAKVFLLKGGFEPVDENLLKGLNFVDIITKPFDSNALVSTIKNLLEEMPAVPPAGTVAPPPPTVPAPPTVPIEETPAVPEAAPPDIPDDLPEIDSMEEMPVGDGISFSDVKDEVGTNNIDVDSMDVDDMDVDDIDVDDMDVDGSRVDDDISPYDEVLPSEEITQGAQQDKYDVLSPTAAEDFDNPFKDEPTGGDGEPGSITEEELIIKRNIEMQEKELEIGSLTQDELDIKQQIGARERDMFRQSLDMHEINLGDEDTSELKPKSNLDNESAAGSGVEAPGHDMFPSFDEEKESDEDDLDFRQPTGEAEPPSLDFDDVEPPSFDDDFSSVPSQQGIPGVDEIPDLDAIEIEKEVGLSSESEETPDRDDLIPGLDDIPEVEDYSQEQQPVESPADFQPPTVPSPVPPVIESVDDFGQNDQMPEYNVPAPPPVEPQVPQMPEMETPSVIESHDEFDQLDQVPEYEIPDAPVAEPQVPQVPQMPQDMGTPPSIEDVDDFDQLGQVPEYEIPTPPPAEPQVPQMSEEMETPPVIESVDDLDQLGQVPEYEIPTQPPAEPQMPEIQHVEESPVIESVDDLDQLGQVPEYEVPIPPQPQMETPPVIRSIDDLEQLSPVAEAEPPMMQDEEPDMDSDMIPGAAPVLEEVEPVQPVPEVEEPTPPVQEVEIPPVAQPAPVEEPQAVSIPAIQNEDLLKKVEDKLTIAIKEMLWEIVPLLAEKIIKKEIEKIKSEAAKSFK